MGTSVTCPKCGAANPAGVSSCRGCGTTLAPSAADDGLGELDHPAREGMYWNWVLLGTGMILALQIVAAYTFIPPLVWAMAVDLKWGMWGIWGVLVAVSAAIYFVAGLLVGRFSAGYTVKEPALASILASLINWALEYFVFHNIEAGIGSAVLGMLICAAIGAAGGSAGETWQNKARDKRRATPPAHAR
jgi:hypothetical protein